MLYKVLADLVLILHFLWILFILTGFILSLTAFLFTCILRFPLQWCKGFLDWWLFRTIHLCGIVYVGFLSVLGKYCPLTILEFNLRQKHNPQLSYPGSFMAHYIAKLVYPDVTPMSLIIPTAAVAVLTLLVFIIKPPAKVIRLFRQSKHTFTK